MSCTFNYMAATPNPDRRSESARRATLDAALALCAESGYANLTIEGIAARAGVSKKTIYRWWPSKGAVLLDAIAEAVTTTATHPDTGHLVDDLVTQLKAVIALLNPPHTSPAAALIAEAMRDEELGISLRETLIRPNIALFDARIRAAQEQGEIPAGIDSMLIDDLVHGTVYHRLVYHLPMPSEAELRERVEVILAGARAHYDTPN